MERTETNVSDASSFVGGEPVGVDIKRRVYGFSLPFSGQLPKLSQLGLGPAFKSKDKVEPLEWDAPHDLKAEDSRSQHPVNHRAHLVKAKLDPREVSRSAIPDIDGTVVVLGGYRGSQLRDTKTNKPVWVPLKVGLRMQKVDLALGLEDEDEASAAEKLYSDQILDHVGPIDICKKLLRRLEKQKNCRVMDWGYDWRLSCTNNSNKFVEHLKRLKMHDPRGVIVVAHSMGGLVAHHALQHFVETNQQVIRGIIYVGVPSECPGILGPLRQDDPVLLAKNILNPATNFSFRSSFVFLPESRKCFYSPDLDEEYDVDFFDVEAWEHNKLSPCLDTEESRVYLKRTLQRNREFKLELKPHPGKQYPPMAVVYGNTLPTVVGARVASRDEIRTTDYSQPVYGSGDGIVFRRTVMPMSAGFDAKQHRIKTIATKDGHVGLLSNLDAIGEALSHLLESEGKTPTFGLVKKQRFAGAREVRERARERVSNLRTVRLANRLFGRNKNSAESIATAESVLEETDSEDEEEVLQEVP